MHGLDRVEVAVVDVDRPAVDVKRAAAVEDRAPAAARAEGAGPAERAQAVGVEGAAVVDGHVPVAVGPVRSLGAGSAERDSPRTGHGRERVGGELEERVVVEAEERPGVSGVRHARPATLRHAWIPPRRLTASRPASRSAAAAARERTPEAQ